MPGFPHGEIQQKAFAGKMIALPSNDPAQWHNVASGQYEHRLVASNLFHILLQHLRVDMCVTTMLDVVFRVVACEFIIEKRCNGSVSHCEICCH
jgi:hypothetical protein